MASFGQFHSVMCCPRISCRYPNLLSDDGEQHFCAIPVDFPIVRSSSHSTLPLHPPHPVDRMERFPRRAATMSGSDGAGYSELLSGVQREKKRWTVAGIDQEELLDVELLADPDSFFYNFNGVQIHHKVYHDEEQSRVENCSQISEIGSEKIGFPTILLHGFGASTFSWSKVIKPLSRLTGSKVLAFDRPAFGLTSRISRIGSFGKSTDTTPLNPYSLAFSVLATLSFVDFLGTQKAILMGHSAGCLVAVNTYFEAPERVAVLILVAPAIVAPFIQRKDSKGRTNDGNSQAGWNSNDTQANSMSRIWKSIRRLVMGITVLAVQMMKGLRDMIQSFYKRTLSAILRSSIAVMLVRFVMDKFSILGVRNAWFDASQVSDHIIQGYTKPLKAKGWEMALLEHTLSLLTDSLPESKNQFSNRLSDISCPVLIVTGDTDRLVPAWNAARLSSAIPGSTLEVIKNCGHVPHEEKPEEFLVVVDRFLQRVSTL